jgi:predicted fused transcriptional regulator/phosphomethylpyrimidine kinase
MLISYLSEELTKKAKEIGFNVFAVDRKVSTSRVGVTSNTVTYEVRRG